MKVKVCLVCMITASSAYAVDFEPRTSYQVTGAALGVAHGDFDGDGLQDVVVGNNSRLILSSLFGMPDGTLGPENVINMPSDAPDVFVSGDFDRDGLDDVAFGEGKDIGVLYGDPSRNFRDFTLFPTGFFTTDMDAADLDGDGVLDLVKVYANSNALSVLYGRSDGTFEDSVYQPAGYQPRGVAVADYNQDGLPDIAITNTLFVDHTINILHGTSQRNVFTSSQFTTLTNQPEALVTDDFNLDGIPDLAYTAHTADSIEVALGLPAGGFAPGVWYPSSDFPMHIDSGDMNGDGVPDLVASDRNSNKITVLVGTGDGTFTPQPHLLMSSNGGSRVELMDLNGDGLEDIAATPASGPYLDVFYIVPEPTIVPIAILGALLRIRRETQA